MFNLIKRVILAGRLEKEELEHKVNVMFLAGQINDDEYKELIDMLE